MIYGEITAFGTPGATRTHYIPLRRRTLYPGEVRGRSLGILTQSATVVKAKATACEKIFEKIEIRACKMEKGVVL